MMVFSGTDLRVLDGRGARAKSLEGLLSVHLLCLGRDSGTLRLATDPKWKAGLE